MFGAGNNRKMVTFYPVSQHRRLIKHLEKIEFLSSTCGNDRTSSRHRATEAKRIRHPGGEQISGMGMQFGRANLRLGHCAGRNSFPQR